jgi:hypothetical protein
MRSIKFDKLGHTDPNQPKLRPISREMAAVPAPADMPQGSLTNIPMQIGETSIQPPSPKRQS